MSLRATARAWKSSQQRGSARLVLLYLAYRANEDSVCWPKVGTIAEAVGLEERQTQNLLSRLAAEGEIEIRPNTTGNRSASYYLVKAGDPSVSWPEQMPKQRVQSSAPLGENGCTPVHPTGAAECTPRVQSSARVQSSTKNGCTPVHPTGAIPYGDSKESESSFERSLESSEVTAAYTVPPQLSAFHFHLSQEPTYQPSDALFRKVLASYSGLDLEEEAMGMVDWLGTPNKRHGGRTPRDDGKQCNSSFVLRWLRRSLDRQALAGDSQEESDVRRNHRSAQGGHI